ncbi:hypothetical protein IP91_04723 [Pseudoduganella lurida]|uniref:Uncharacterized protein n=1 Tax=Pseudoduganella lurida TaxID=1036180 RepID=A0A562QYC7_9BURK|nr:hypothetical protein [Pseudoduganella lurida]TWI61136.1 hypothetical protein IP91_04723 [Pseudoduganella lurida]
MDAQDALHPDSLQAHFQPHVAVDEIEQVFHLKRAQPLLQVFTALFHGGFDSVLVRLLVLRELATDTSSTAFSRADINTRLAYLLPESLETVLMRLRTNQLLAWDAQQGVYRVTPMARNVLSALDGLLGLGQQEDEDAGMGFLLSQVAGAQAVGGVTVEQLQHLLGRLTDLTEEFRDAIASGSEFRLRESQEKWHTACDWVEKGSEILRAITSDENADAATQRAAQAIGRAQSSLLNMQGMFSRALNQIERQRVHLGQSGLSTTDIKRWLLAHSDLASLAEDAIEQPVKPLFITPAEMIDVAETELLTERVASAVGGLPSGENAPLTMDEGHPMQRELDDWLTRLSDFATLNNFPSIADESPRDIKVHEALLPASFAVASYRASMLPLLGDEGEASLQGATADLARLPLQFAPTDMMVQLDDMEVAAMSLASLSLFAPPPPSPDSTESGKEEN